MQHTLKKKRGRQHCSSLCYMYTCYILHTSLPLQQLIHTCIIVPCTSLHCPEERCLLFIRLLCYRVHQIVCKQAKNISLLTHMDLQNASSLSDSSVIVSTRLSANTGNVCCYDNTTHTRTHTHVRAHDIDAQARHKNHAHACIHTTRTRNSHIYTRTHTCTSN